MSEIVEQYLHNPITYFGKEGCYRKFKTQDNNGNSLIIFLKLREPAAFEFILEHVCKVFEDLNDIMNTYDPLLHPGMLSLFLYSKELQIIYQD